MQRNERAGGAWWRSAPMLVVVAALAVAGVAGTGLARGQAAEVGAQAEPRLVVGETEAVGPGVRHTEFRWSLPQGSTEGDLLQVDLANPRVSVDLIDPGVVAARDEVSDMAEAQHAVAAVNGDFFNIGETNAPVGPAVADGVDLKAAVPLGQAFGPSAPGRSTEDVFGVGADRVGRLDRLSLRGSAVTSDGAIGLDGLNQYAIRVGGIGAFTPEWGTASRKRSTCGSDTSRTAPCSEQTAEVLVRDGVVSEILEQPGSGPIARGAFVLVGRDAGADRLREQLTVGERVTIDYELVESAGGELEFAVGGAPIMRDRRPLVGLNATVLAPRTAAGVSADGRRLYLLTVDGRSAESRGLSLLELAELARAFGADDAMNLDGGGSSTLVAEEPGEDQVTVQNVPSDGAERPVPNGVGVFVSDPPTP